jgi:archaellum component FlaF (FlaF/FlaG flagellin family)
MGSRGSTRGAVLSIAVGILAASLLQSAGASLGVTELVSVRSNGDQGDNISGRFAPPAINTDGGIVAFDSIATNLVRRDTNDQADVFVHDRAADITERVSVNNRGRQGNGFSTRPDLDGPGDLVVFDSAATNLVPGDTNQSLDVFVHDRTTGTTERVSVRSNAAQGNSGSHSPSISSGGRFVAFVSTASNLVPGDTNGVDDVFVRDLVAGTTERVSLRTNGTQGNSSTTQTSISANGRWVAFSSFATNLVPGDTNGHFDVFIHDRQTGTTELVSVRSNEAQADAPSTSPSVSRDGELVAFQSTATNLVASDTNDRMDAFVRNRTTGTTERVSVNSAEEQANGGSEDGAGIGFPTTGPDITTNGRFVAFHSTATNLVPGDTNTCPPVFDDEPGRCPDVFVRDRVAGTTVRVNVAGDGTQANERSAEPAISENGMVVAFFSAADNLVPGDDNACPPEFPTPGHCPDIFVRAGGA